MGEDQEHWFQDISELNSGTLDDGDEEEDDAAAAASRTDPVTIEVCSYNNYRLRVSQTTKRAVE
jgi:hypothetical protein